MPMDHSPFTVTRPQGLTSAEAKTTLERVGPNALQKTRHASPVQVFARQFVGFLILILIGAAGVALALGEVIDAIGIMLVVLINGVLGFVQEWRAETALAALQNMLSTAARVLRDGREQMIDTREIVPGDVVLLEAGDRVPADLKLSEAVQLKVDESVLTGESFPVDKEAIDDSVIYMGTSVVAGRAEGVVTATGQATEFGQIADLTGGIGTKTTNLQRQLGLLAKQIGMAALMVALLVGLVGVMTGQPPVAMLMTALSLAVAIVPEGLPAVVTVTLALGAAAMVRQHALARRLQAVETLGAATVICTDKTGTLTQDEMTAAEIWTPDGSFTATGAGYDPTGHISNSQARVRAGDDPALGALLETALICNHARLHREGDQWEMIGEPTEGALVTLGYKGWAPLPAPNSAIAELPFSSERKRMSVLAQSGSEFVLHSKGAPEQILECSNWIRRNGVLTSLDETQSAEILNAYEAMAKRGLRVIAMARHTQTDATLPASEGDMEFLGFVGLIDPPRVEVKGAIAACRSAGIRIIMITGDSPVTARAVAEQLDLPVSRVLTGHDIEDFSDEQLTSALAEDVLFARTKPAHKMRIVQALQSRQDIVVMTGDGVNDAPALKQADIGVAMGIRGTDVARDASDLVLLDDNFTTIFNAIREGRRQYDNIKKFVRYLLSSNSGEVLAITANLLIGGPLIFLATQILWINLVTDGVTAVALGLEKATPDQIKRPPRAKSEPILGRMGLATIVGFGIYTGLASLWVFYTVLPQGEVTARTAAFTTMLLSEKASVFAFRSLTQPCTRIGWFSNPMLHLALAASVGAHVAAVYWAPLQLVLHTGPLSWAHWQMILILLIPLIVVPELFKMVRTRFQA
ncbi:cation-translocating P-type ATPase [Actibacterium lipolyticum]|uniref:Calcium-transporting ATPase n=1 Tax=Actibacterium lipolyticum TaxID=1524263 RepID=A0A238KMY4_9RHOB|nr:cation-transporting P-type ATPase [Actibacterium lipolyticum]SMX44174.1 Calcium-transporting ATPase [Actibacterium lipolyticum]